jgi:hypothetical protein
MRERPSLLATHSGDLCVCASLGIVDRAGSYIGPSHRIRKLGTRIIFAAVADDDISKLLCDLPFYGHGKSSLQSRRVPGLRDRRWSHSRSKASDFLESFKAADATITGFDFGGGNPKSERFSVVSRIIDCHECAPKRSRLKQSVNSSVTLQDNPILGSPTIEARHA